MPAAFADPDDPPALADHSDPSTLADPPDPSPLADPARPPAVADPADPSALAEPARPPAFAEPAATSRPLHVVAPEALEDWRAAQPAATADWLNATGFEAAYGDLRLLPGIGGVAGAVVGLGSAQARARSRFGLIRNIATLPAGTWHLTGTLTPDQRDEAALGWLLSAYRFDRYRKAAPLAARLKAPEGCDAAALQAMAQGENFTRDLINTPASDMGPADLEEVARDLADRHAARITVTTGDDLLTANFPMIHAVGRASPRAPRLIDMVWGTAGPALTLVGKGVCFDTGGLNLKPSAGMSLMKKDMGGAATMFASSQ